MAILPGNTGRADDFINESERNATPANDVGRVVKLEDDGRLGQEFLRNAKTTVYDLADSPVTWTKPDKLVAVKVEAWGGGGSGTAASNTSTVASRQAGGGAGGAYVSSIFYASELPTTVEIIVGAGGASRTRSSDGETAGLNGGNSSFGSLLIAYGGGRGTDLGGNGGSALGADSGRLDAGLANQDGYFGGAGGANPTQDISHRGGSAYLGGAGGGGARARNPGSGIPTAYEINPPGVSVFGGNGGAASSVESGASTANPGETPSGGGGGARTNATSTSTSGAGGDGRVIVTEYY